jgi:hypothetical protein
MMENIKALLQNAQLQQQMKDATDLERTFRTPLEPLDSILVIF